MWTAVTPVKLVERRRLELDATRIPPSRSPPTMLILVTHAFRRPLTRWVGDSPEQVANATALALLVGGSFFLFYWGILGVLGMGGRGFSWDRIPRLGFSAGPHRDLRA